MRPQRPDDLAYLRGWFLVETKGNYREARRKAEDYVLRRRAAARREG